jgi:hypothetical protein
MPAQLVNGSFCLGLRDCAHKARSPLHLRSNRFDPRAIEQHIPPFFVETAKDSVTIRHDA